MKWKREAYTDEEWDKVSHGKLCPNHECKSDDIKYMGCTPDGMYANCAWDCNSCGEQWEGK